MILVRFRSVACFALAVARLSFFISLSERPSKLLAANRLAQDNGGGGGGCCCCCCFGCKRKIYADEATNTRDGGAVPLGECAPARPGSPGCTSFPAGAGEGHLLACLLAGNE
jgi:hypothetical protein